MMKKIWAALSISGLTLLIGCGASLPDHTVEKSSLGGNATRVQVNTNDAALSKEDCEKLITEYRDDAGEGGQVSVHKPSAALQNTLQPFCVDNMEGEGTFFNEFFFPEE